MAPTKKVKVDRQAVAAAVHRKPLPPWCQDCPIQEEDPFLGSQPPSLPPGAALEACSGSDIYYQKASTKRIKYLALLPGNLAFDHQQNPSKAKAAPKKDDDEDDAKPAATESTALTQETLASMTQESTASTPIPSVAAASSMASAKAVLDGNTVVLGQVRGLTADTGTTLTLPLGDNHRQVQFKGHKVTTASKYLVLTLQPKKGRVVCKDVFSSVLVFGDPQEVVSGPAANGVAKAKSDSILMDDDNDDSDADNVLDGVSSDNGKAKSSALEHYGGSARAWDGSMQGKLSTETIAASSSAKKTSAVKKIIEIQHSNDEDSDDNVMEAAYDSDEFHMDLAAPAPKRTAPRRQSRKQVKYRELADVDSESSEDQVEMEDDDSSVEEKPPKTPRRSKSPGGSQSTKKTASKLPRATSKSNKLDSTKKTATKPASKMSLSDDSDESDASAADLDRAMEGDDDDEFKMDISDTEHISKRTPSRRLSTRGQGSSAKKYAEDEESFDDEQSKASQEGEKKTAPKKRTKKVTSAKIVSKPTSKRASAAAAAAPAPKRKLHDSEDDDSFQNDSDSSFEDLALSRLSSKKKAGKSLKDGAKKSAPQKSTPAPRRSNAKQQSSLELLAPDSSESDQEPTRAARVSSRGGKDLTSFKKELGGPDDSIDLTYSDSSRIEVLETTKPNPRKKVKLSSDEDSDFSLEGASSKNRKKSGSVPKSSSKAPKKTVAKLENVENDDLLNMDSDSESLDTSVAKSVLVKGISRGKAAKTNPSPVKPETTRASPAKTKSSPATHASPLANTPGTPGSSRRRRSPGRPKSAQKTSLAQFADDEEFTFL